MNRRKPHDIKIQEQAYIRHLKKIQQLMNGNSYNQKKTKEQNKKILKLIKESHKLHSLSKYQQRLLRQKSINKMNQSNMDIYRRAQSVVKIQISKSVVKLPQRYTKKLQNYQMEKENQKLNKRLLQTKPYIINNLQKYYFSQKKLLPPIQNTFDFSRLYFQSPNSQYHLKKLKLELKLSKKPNSKLIFQFIDQSLMKCLKQHQNCLLSVQPIYNGHKAKTASRTYEQIFKSQFQIDLNLKQKNSLFQLRFYKSFQNKNQYLYKGNIIINLSSLIQQSNNDQYSIIKEKVIHGEKQLGSIEIRVKLKSLKKKIINSCRKTIQQQQQQTSNNKRIKKLNNTQHIQLNQSLNNKQSVQFQNSLNYA